MQEQYYVFEWEGSWWAEMFYTDSEGDHHVSAPTPFPTTMTADAVCDDLQCLHPDAMVDELFLTEDIADAKRFAIR